MTSYFVKGYKEKYGKEPNVNRYAARWGFDALLQGTSKADSKLLVDYYFTTPSAKRHDIDWFFYNYEKLAQSMIDAEEAARERRVLMEASKIRAEAWRQSGKQGIANS